MVFHPTGKHNPDIKFVFKNNDLGVSQNPDLIYPIERIKYKKDSSSPAYKVPGTLMKT